MRMSGIGILSFTSLLVLSCIAAPRSGQNEGKAPLEKGEIPPQPGASLEPLFDEFEQPDMSRWVISDGYSNGPIFHCGWRKDNVSFEASRLRLRMDDQGCPSACSGKPFAAGEYQSTKKYGYGRYEARMKPAKISGTMSGSIFTYNADPQDEIDIEFLGKDTTILQTNYFTSGVGQHVTNIDLGFDASESFHDYAFEWRPDSITWFVDGKAVHVEDGSRGKLPQAAGALIVNIWPGHTVEGWLGPVRYEGKPVYAEYEWIRFTPLAKLGPEDPKNRELKQVDRSYVPEVSGNEWLIDDFEGGELARNESVWVSEADRHNLGTRIEPSPFVRSQGGSASSPGFCGHIKGHLGPSRAPWPYAVLSLELKSPMRPVNLAQFKKLEFNAKGNGRKFRVQLSKASIADWGHPQVEFSPGASFQKFSFPLTQFAQPSWAVKVGSAPNDVTSIVFGAIDGDQDFELFIDDVRFVK